MERLPPRASRGQASGVRLLLRTKHGRGTSAASTGKEAPRASSALGARPSVAALLIVGPSAVTKAVGSTVVAFRLATNGIDVHFGERARHASQVPEEEAATEVRSTNSRRPFAFRSQGKLRSGACPLAKGDAAGVALVRNCFVAAVSDT